MSISKPVAAPVCWGTKYQDGDRECGQCRFDDTCRVKMLEVLTQPTSSYHPPPSPPPPPPNSSGYPFLPVYQPSKPTGIVPTPPKPPTAPISTTSPAPIRYTTPSVPQPTYQPPVQYQTQQYQTPQQYHNVGYSIQDPPNPISPIHRPGAPGPAYHFTQYPGETILARLTKNMVLRGLEAIFSELMYFFRHWTWPPKK